MSDRKDRITVIGAGLAGCEAAFLISRMGIKVDLYEMKPVRKSPAHKSDLFAELVCSNSLRAASITNAVGLLMEELRRMGSLVMEAADKAEALERIDRVRKRFVGKKWEEDDSLVTSFSGGMVCCAECKTYAEAISQADKLLYSAKESGRNRICLSV